MSLAIYATIGFYKKGHRWVMIHLTSLYSSFYLKLFGIKITLNIENRSSVSKNYLIVSNHLSYLDVLVISKFFPSCFITSTEIKETPFLGWICRLNASLFVNRKNFRQLALEIREVAQVLSSGYNVAFFPEATSTNGSELLEFKKPLFKSAVQAQKNILPLCINYTSIDGLRVTEKNRESVFWYGDASFLPHLLKLLKCRTVDVELSVLSDINPLENKAELSDISYQKIKENFIPVIPEGSFALK